MIKWLQFILLTISQPILCCIGIINNSLIILVIRNRSMQKEFQESMYKHILINAGFNIVFCLITILKLINTCIFYGSGIYCSGIYQEVLSQYFKLIVIHFLGNAVKMCSNISYLAFSISRLLLVTKTINKNLKRNKTTLKGFYFLYLFVMLAICSTLSLFKLFQFRLNIDVDVKKDFPYEFRNEFYCNDEMHKYECKLFNAFKIVNRILNDILCIFLNVLIDLILLTKFKQHMESKLKQINDLAQHKLIEKSKKNLNRMILFNSFIYVLSHLPEFLVTLLLIIYSKAISNFCKNKFSCDLLNEEAEFFCLISIVCQFYVLRNFDKNFKRSFEELKSNLYSLVFK